VTLPVCYHENYDNGHGNLDGVMISLARFGICLVATVYAYVHYSIAMALVCGITISCACCWLLYVLKSPKGFEDVRLGREITEKGVNEDKIYITRAIRHIYM
jgi:hypothetical protein